MFGNVWEYILFFWESIWKHVWKMQRGNVDNYLTACRNIFGNVEDKFRIFWNNMLKHIQKRLDFVLDIIGTPVDTCLDMS